MKWWHNLTLNRKLLICFFAAIFALSMFHLLSYLRLLNTMTLEARASATERMSSAMERLDESLSQVRNDYFSLTYTDSFRRASGSGQPSESDLVDLYQKAQLYLGTNKYISAYAILFNNAENIVTSGGTYSAERFSPTAITVTLTIPPFGNGKTAPPSLSATTRRMCLPETALSPPTAVVS